MKRVLVLGCFALSVTLSSAWSLEGTLPKEQTELINDGKWWFLGEGTWNIKDIVSCYNGYAIIKNRVKVGLDPKLATKTLVDFKIKEYPIQGGLEKMAEKINAKLYAINNSFLYVASELPHGFVLPGQSAGAGKETKTAGSAGATSLPVIFPYCQVGCSTVIPWSHVSLEDAKKDPRPKILFVYDNDPHIETNNTGHFFETLLLEDPECLAALKGIYYIRVCADEKQVWPDNFLEPAKMPDAVKALPKGWKKPAEKDAKEPTNPASWSCNKGAALYLLRPDCSVTSISWTERNPQFTARQLIDAARPLMEAYKAKSQPEKPKQQEPPQTPKSTKPDQPKSKSDDEKE